MRVRNVLALIAVAIACSDPGPSGPTADPCDTTNIQGSANAAFSATGIFTVSPIPVASITSITPLGNLNPPDHVYPTSHIYIIPQSSTAGANSVSAAAAGTIVKLYQPGGSDWKMMIKVDQSFFYFYDHITPAAGLGEGAVVNAGQVVGTNSGAAAALDLGVYDFNLPQLTGILNACALKGVGQVGAPLKYYTAGLQTQLYAKVTVTGAATKDGKIDYDQAGKLVGNWVLAGHKPTDPPSNLLAFTYNVSSRAMRISAGSALGGGGSFGVPAGTADFSTITPASGQVNFRLYRTNSGDSSPPGPEYGVLAVQMVSATSIKVEIFPGNLTGAATLTANALTYDR